MKPTGISPGAWQGKEIAQTSRKLATLVFLSSSVLIREIAPELTGHGLPLSKCEAYNAVAKAAR
jgi:hypothetical protein